MAAWVEMGASEIYEWAYSPVPMGEAVDRLSKMGCGKYWERFEFLPTFFEENKYISFLSGGLFVHFPTTIGGGN